MWSIRLYHHFRSVGCGVFFTFTYRDDTLPYQTDYSTGDSYPTVDKPSVQAFFKKCRVAYKRGTGKSISYFITSEYGPRTLRPHYHGVIFGISELDFRLYFSSVWEKEFGFTTFSVLSLSRDSLKQFRYVAKYCSKGVFENPRVADGLVAPTFHLISKSIGKSYLTDETINYHLSRFVRGRFDSFHRPSDEYLSSLVKSLRVDLDGFSYKMPRYYKDILFASRKNLQSFLSDFISEESLSLRDRQFGLVQPDGKPNHSAYKTMLDSDLRSSIQREKNVKKSFAKYLDKSKI